MSVSDISFQTGIARTTVWSTLKRHKFSTRKVESIPFDQWRRGRGKTGPRPPYGFSFFQGDVIKDPKEYPVLQLILNLWKQGTSISSIVRHLDGKRIKSRTGKPWSYNVVKAVVQRDPTQYQKLSKAKKREKK